MRRTKKTGAVIILSLIASLFPLYFLMCNINVSIDQKNHCYMINGDNNLFFIADDIDTARYIEKSYPDSSYIIERAYCTPASGDSTVDINATFIDENLDKYEKITVIKGRMMSFNPDDRECMMEDNILTYFNINLGDTVYVFGEKFTLVGLVERSYQQGTMYLPKAYHSNRIHASNAFVFLEKNDETVALLNQAKIPYQTASEFEAGETDIIYQMIRQHTTIGGYLMLMALVNLSMIFIGEFEQTKRSVGIQRLLGARKSQVVLTVLIKNIILTLIADGIIYLSSPILHSTFYLYSPQHFSVWGILIHMAISLIMPVILTFIFAMRMNRYSLIEYVKEAA